MVFFKGSIYLHSHHKGLKDMGLVAEIYPQVLAF